MKRLILFTVLSVGFLFNTVGQSTVDPKSYLTPEQLQKYESDLKVAQIEENANNQIENLEKKLETYGKWVGVGGEVGTAIHEGLDAVVDVSGKFGKTDVGKFTLVMIGWKVMGRDIVRILLGIIFFLITIKILIRLYNNNCTKYFKTITSKSGWLFWKKIEYEVEENDIDEGTLVLLNIVYTVVLFISIWITYGIMFS